MDASPEQSKETHTNPQKRDHEESKKGQIYYLVGFTPQPWPLQHSPLPPPTSRLRVRPKIGRIDSHMHARDTIPECRSAKY